MPATSESREARTQRWFQETKLSDYYLEGAGSDSNEDRSLLIPDIREITATDEQVIDSMARKEYKAALSAAQNMINEYPLFYYGYVRKAQIHLIKKNYQKALRTLELGKSQIVLYSKITTYKVMRTVEEQDAYEHNRAALNRHTDEAFEILAPIGHECSNAPHEERDEKFKLGLQIARTLTKLRPDDCQGYILAATIYRLQQNRAMALRSCRHGLSKTKGEDKKAMLRYKERFRQDFNSLVPDDVFMRLPKDVVAQVFTYLPMDSVFECMKVSDAWRRCILKLRQPFRAIRAEGFIDVYLLREAAKSIRKIHLERVGAKPMRRLLEALGEQIFVQLREFSTDACDYVRNDKCVLGLMKVTHLSIKNDVTGNIPPLTLILQLCTKLRKLVYYQHYPIRYPALDLDEDSPNITRLTIGCTIRGAGEHKTPLDRVHEILCLNNLLRQMKNLTFLHIVSDTYKPKGYLSLCPKLTTLMVGIFDSEYFDKEHKHTPPLQGGLRHMRVTGNGVAVGAFREELRANKRSLESLWIGNVNPGQTERDFYPNTWWVVPLPSNRQFRLRLRRRIPPKLTLRRVTKLTFSFTAEELVLFWLVRYIRFSESKFPELYNAEIAKPLPYPYRHFVKGLPIYIPELRELSIYCLKDTSSLLFRMLGRYQLLQRLTLKWCQKCNRPVDIHLFRFLVPRRIKSILEYLCIDQCILGLEKCLPSVANLPALRTLKILNCAGVNRHVVGDLIEALAERNCLLTEFELVGGSRQFPPNDRSFQLVHKAFPKLQRLRLGDLTGITQKTIKEFGRLKEYKRLGEVHIHGCVTISRRHIRKPLNWVPTVIFEY